MMTGLQCDPRRYVIFSLGEDRPDVIHLISGSMQHFSGRLPGSEERGRNDAGATLNCPTLDPALRSLEQDQAIPWQNVGG